MKYREILEACWKGYHKEGMKTMFGKRYPNCVKNTNEELEEDLRKWFKEKWVRFGPDGKIRGDCARGDDSEGKPKCLPQSKAQNLGKKGRASAAARKRRQDPNPERQGKAINVNTKKKTDEAIDRRGFLKGMGAAAAGYVGAQATQNYYDTGDWSKGTRNVITRKGSEPSPTQAGGAKAGWFSSPKLFANGAYSGSVRHYLGNYSDSGAVGDAGKDYDITVKINGNNIVMHVHGRGPITKSSSSSPMDFEFSNFTKTPDGILAKKTKSNKSVKGDGYEPKDGDPNNLVMKNPREVIDTTVETLEIKNDGALKYRKITSSDSPQKPGWKYHAWGYNGSVKTTGKELNESVEQGVAEQELDEKWSQEYKSSINCANPKGFSQRAHCAGKKKNESVTEATGYIPVNSKEAQDPRYSMAITQDIRPGEVQRQAAKMGFKTDAAGVPPLLMKLQNQLKEIKAGTAR